jgi:hypothetical protein
MKFECQEVSESFIKVAPMCFVNEVILDATPEDVFSLFEDESSWPKWFKGMKKVEWTSPKPFGEGTTRTVTLDVMRVYEHFFIWEQNKRFAFYFTGTSLPFVKALCEDYVLTPISEKQTKFTYTVACEPILLVRILGPLAKFALNKMFKDSTVSLQEYIRNRSV